jgi:hypothetical protein
MTIFAGFFDGVILLRGITQVSKCISLSCNFPTVYNTTEVSQFLKALNLLFMQDGYLTQEK